MPSPTLAPAPPTWRAWGTVALLGCAWASVFNLLRLDWSTNPQYSYGWLVPFLAAYLFWARWPSRPLAVVPPRSGWVLVAAGALAFLFLPTHLVSEAAPEWSVVRWALTLEAVGLTLLALREAAGPATMRHFAWPVCFLLVGVAWPAQFEGWLTQALMHKLAAVTAELLSWAGFSAVAQGNLLQLQTGVLGVDEACSGVRSLQSMLMASLFLGELNRCSALGRLALVAAGLALALFCNLVRALFLAGVAIHGGISAVGLWHDPAGFTILAASFVLLCLLVRFFDRRGPLPAPPLAPAGPWQPPSKGALIALAAWLIFTELGTELWYRSHESGGPEKPAWSIHWPETRANFLAHPVAPTVRKLLAYNEGRQASWDEPDGSSWQMFAFRWYPGRSSTVSARQHRPEVCLPAWGRTLVAEHPPTVLEIGTASVPFRTYQFSEGGKPLFVFFCLWETGNRDVAASGLSQAYTRQSRLARVRIGQRNLGQQSAEVIISGLGSVEEAVAAFRRRAGDFLVGR